MSSVLNEASRAFCDEATTSLSAVKANVTRTGDGTECDSDTQKTNLMRTGDEAEYNSNRQKTSGMRTGDETECDFNTQKTSGMRTGDETICDSNTQKTSGMRTGDETECDFNTQKTSEIRTGDEAECDSDTQKLSKKQQKRLLKCQRWEKYKHEIRAREKEKKKQRKKEAIERGEEIPPSRKRLKQNTMAKSSCRLNVVVDCSFDEYMNERDIMILGRQLQFCYSSNRRVADPVQFHICGITGQLKTRLDSVGDYKNWDVHKHEKQYWEEFQKENLVYLSGDSQNVLHDLDHSKVYVIGGLVDHNHHKGLCHRLAEERGIPHAQLPIGEYINMKTRKVLTVNHVFDILLHYTETKDWQKAFFSVIPQRKGLELKDKLANEGNENKNSSDCG